MSSEKPWEGCIWTQEECDGQVWETGCYHVFEVSTDGLPSEHQMQFCCYCGGALKEVTKMQQIDGEDL